MTDKFLEPYQNYKIVIPTREDIINLVAQYRDLKIKDVDDKEGYDAVHRARILLKNTRVSFVQGFKERRAAAREWQAKVIAEEKDFVSLVEPVETILDLEEERIDKEKARIKRMELLPERRAKLLEIELTVPDERLLNMDDNFFENFYLDAKNTYLVAKEEKMRADALKKQQEELAKRGAEVAALEAEKKRLAEENQRLEDEKKRIEQEKVNQARIEEEAKRRVEFELKRKEEERILEEARKEREAKEEQEKLAKKKKYKEWLLANNVTEETKGQFQITGTSGEYVLWKKVSTLII